MVLPGRLTNHFRRPDKCLRPTIFRALPKTVKGVTLNNTTEMGQPIPHGSSVDPAPFSFFERLTPAIKGLCYATQMNTAEDKSSAIAIVRLLFKILLILLNKD